MLAAETAETAESAETAEATVDFFSLLLKLQLIDVSDMEEQNIRCLSQKQFQFC